jgi:hypothetical protein
LFVHGGEVSELAARERRRADDAEQQQRGATCRRIASHLIEGGR